MNDLATMLELMRTELLRDSKDSMFYVANTNQELIFVKKKVGNEYVWALPKEEDFKAFEKKIADYIQNQRKNGK